MVRIIIIGYMGAGKTTVGKALSKETGYPFYDLDWYIETRMRKSVSQLFAERGEEGFRKIEHAMLHEVAEFENVIISCGGGTPCFFDNMDYLNQQGHTVYLKADPEVLRYHLLLGKGVRPLLQGKTPEQMLEFITEQLAKREPFYTKARHILDVNKLDRGGLNEYARCSYFTGHFADALKASEAGLKLFPRNPTFTRLAMFSNYELKNLDAAKAYIHKYFNETDSMKPSEYDHFYAALIHQDLGEKENAYAQFDKALELVNDSSMIKRHAILKTLSDSHLKDQSFEKAIKYYQDYLACKPDLNSDDTEGLAKIYSKYADADESKKTEMIGKAIATYREMGEKFPIQNVYAAYQCATMSNKLDKNGEKGLAKADFQKVVDLLANKADRDKSENTMLKYSYHYLMTNAFLYGKNKALAKEYADKILAIDPEYAPAQQIRDIK